MSCRIVLVMHTTSYGAAGFVEACRRADAQVVIASDRCHVLDRAWRWPAESVVIDFSDPGEAAKVIAKAAVGADAPGDPISALPLRPILAVLPVGGELPARVAAAAARYLGLQANAPEATLAASNKLVMRDRLTAGRPTAAAADLLQPRYVAVPRTTPPGRVAEIIEGIGFPCVIKPLALSASRGVMRADDPATLAAAFERLVRLLEDPAVRRIDPEAAEFILIESFVPGPELALEGLLSDGVLDVLALFDKPDPLDGPFFEETIYVTPSRAAPDDQRRVAEAVAAAAAALGLSTGPIHAEVRLGPQGPVVIEVAARPIGGLCARALRFEGDLGLEDVVVRHALGQAPRPPRDPRPSGVMMIPIPVRRPSALRGVEGVEAARAVPCVTDLTISVRPGETVVPLPEGASYLGFIFAVADTPAGVEQALRDALARLSFSFAPLL